jgi:Ca-activated chloride channel family protein
MAAARPRAAILEIVEDTRDADVLANILDDLPLSFAFPAGKTDLFAGLAAAARIARPWRPGSATVLVVTDGDTVPATGLPKMPESVSGVLLVGVGDPTAGKFIDGHMSRQDVATLRQVALRAGGIYHDGNTKQVPTDALATLGMVPRERLLDRLALRDYAILATVVGTVLLALQVRLGQRPRERGGHAHDKCLVLPLLLFVLLRLLIILFAPHPLS